MRKTEIMISGEDSKSGKATELTSFRESYINKIWEETKSFRTGSIRDGLVGYLNSKTNFFEKCRFVNHMLHEREKEKEPHEETSSLRDA